MLLFFDTEFTGFRKDTDIISIAIYCPSKKKSFYAEYTDYNRSKIDDWLKENVIDNLILSKYNDRFDCEYMHKGEHHIKGDHEFVNKKFLQWVQEINPKKQPIEVWSDCCNYDWTLFVHDLCLGEIPELINYIPRDICTFFDILGLDPDTTREKFIDKEIEGSKHNSLYDVKVIYECYKKLMHLLTYKQIW